MKVAFIGTEVRTAELVTLAVHLRWPDVNPIVATTAAEGLEMVEREAPDVVVMHPDFTDMTLSSTIGELRGFTNVPLLVLGHEGDEMEVVTSLEVGADDYVRLPCDLTEIMVRIWALLRRVGLRTEPDADGPISSGRLVISPSTYEVFMDDRRVVLTSTEFRLLHLLVKNRGTVVAHQTLERALWGGYMDSSRLVKKYVQRLRRKLGDHAREPVWIASVHGVGYRFIGPPLASQVAPQPLTV
ncbi:MAG: response regulator transcription factor [Gemmatimonadetes bacterium]|nr:response regulator transcription factor [Gemmatimonadota bacterium]